MAEPPLPNNGGGLSCVFRDCDNNASTCVYTCVFSSSPFLSPPHFPPPSPATTAIKSSQSRLAPFLIAMVCILGISFLLLTTCTIILRYRFSNRRRNSTSRVDDEDGDTVVSVVDHPIWHIATVGLQQSVIDSITAFKYKKVDGLLIDGSDCSVCLTGFEDGDDLRLLPKCNHAFHIPCIDTWLRSHKNCPLCRAPVVNDNSRVEIIVNQLSSGNLDVEQEEEMENLENNTPNNGGESSYQLREMTMTDDFVGLSISETLNKNR